MLIWMLVKPQKTCWPPLGTSNILYLGGGMMVLGQGAALSG
jgi:hypothetical protein